jgi:hypothetical protein
MIGATVLKLRLLEQFLRRNLVRPTYRAEKVIQ